jgi:hypothetical protein
MEEPEPHKKGTGSATMIATCNYGKIIIVKIGIMKIILPPAPRVVFKLYHLSKISRYDHVY